MFLFVFGLHGAARSKLIFQTRNKLIFQKWILISKYMEIKAARLLLRKLSLFRNASPNASVIAIFVRGLRFLARLITYTDTLIN